MSNIIIFIEDKIRDERVRIRANVNSPVEKIIAWYTEEYRLPHRDFDLGYINYHLFRAVDKTKLSAQTTLGKANIAEGELLQLTSAEGRRVWRVVQKILDEIESHTKDKITGKIKDRVTEEVWEWATNKLDEIEKTHTGGDRVDRICDLIDQIGGPTKIVDIAEEVVDVVEPYKATSKGVGGSVGGAIKSGLATVFIGGSLTVVIIGGILLYNSIFPPSPTPTKEPTAPPRATKQELPEPENIDSDGDYLFDNQEIEIGTDLNNPDSDEDGLLDGDEVLEFRTNPLYPDTDGDSYWDGKEIEMGTNPLDPYDPALESASQEAEEHFHRAMELTTRNAFDEAISEFNQAIELDPENDSYYIERGKAFMSLEELDAALSDFMVAIEINPVDAYYWVQRGQCYGRMEDDRSAIADFTQAIKLDPNYPDPYGYRGWNYANLEQYDAAREDYKVFLSLTGNNPDYYDWRENVQSWLDENP